MYMCMSVLYSCLLQLVGHPHSVIFFTCFVLLYWLNIQKSPTNGEITKGGFLHFNIIILICALHVCVVYLRTCLCFLNMCRCWRKGNMVMCMDVQHLLCSCAYTPTCRSRTSAATNTKTRRTILNSSKVVKKVCCTTYVTTLFVSDFRKTHIQGQ